MLGTALGTVLRQNIVALCSGDVGTEPLTHSGHKAEGEARRGRDKLSGAHHSDLLQVVLQ